MPILNPDDLEGVKKPEIVIGLVAPLGTPLNHIYTRIEKQLEKYEYESSKIRLSDFLEGIQLETPHPTPTDRDYIRIKSLMDRGDQLRSILGGNEALSLLAAAKINSLRPDQEPQVLSGKAFVIHQLKHPDEVIWLRNIYQRAFQLIAVYCPEDIRLNDLIVHRGMKKQEARELIERDKGDDLKYGQHVTKTFRHADLFVELKSTNKVDLEDANNQLKRYFDLFFGNEIITPTRDEYGMYIAKSASLRSADLSRQVGASIFSENGDLISLGANDVPCYGGGQYWPGADDARDYSQGKDSNAVIKYEILTEVLENLISDWDKKSQSEKLELKNKYASKLKSSRLMNLTEFGRAVHAEMEAILSSGRIGASLRNSELFTTTFPCHNCAKHIVGAGIKRVIYIEPYPKSLADRLHSDSISFSEDSNQENKVSFEPFRGIAPRCYPSLFSYQTFEGKKITKKTPEGKLIREPFGLRLKATPLNHIDREAVASLALNSIFK